MPLSELVLDWVTLPVKLPRVVKFEMLVLTGSTTVACGGMMGKVEPAVSSRVAELPLGAVALCAKTEDADKVSKVMAMCAGRNFFMAVPKKWVGRHPPRKTSG